MKVLIGVSGSISCYKAYDLCRSFVKNGHEVKVVLTSGAEKMIKGDLFRYLGAQEVYSSGDDFNTTKIGAKNVIHIELAEWADRIIIAPLSANTLAKIAAGMATDLLTSVVLAGHNRPLLLFPAMNTKMLENPITRSNFEKLKSLLPCFVAETAEGILACGDEGKGKLLPVEKIFYQTLAYQPQLQEKEVLISTGATISSLDPFRFLTNASSGKTGFELALAFLEQGYKVQVVAGKNSTPLLGHLVGLPQFSLTTVTTNKQMEQTISKRINYADLYISAAAICDIDFDTKTAKLKKEELKNSLPVKSSKDILKEVLKNKLKNQKIIGFAAESSLDEQLMLQKWRSKPVDLLIGNLATSGYIPGEKANSFGTDLGNYCFISNDKVLQKTPLTKSQLAKKVVDWFEHDQLL